MSQKKEYKNCMKRISTASVARRGLSFQTGEEELSETQNLSARIYRTKRKNAKNVTK